jgi:hypothetical protein
MADDHTDVDEANRERAKEEERYRDEVSKGDHGAHKPCEKFPIEEANEEGAQDDSQGKAATNVHVTIPAMKPEAG